VKNIINLLRIALFTNKVRLSQTENEKFLAQQALARILADTKGLAMKIGQLYADTEGENAFNQLTKGVEPLPLRQMLPVLNEQLGFSSKKVFTKIDEAVAAASLGQVHFAELKTGEKVALKIRYSNITLAIETELRLAGLLPEIGPAKQWGFDVKSYKINLRKNMLRELDYLSEANRQNEFAKRVQVDGLYTPVIHHDLCREGVLVQSRASGVMIDRIKGWPEPDKKIIGKILLTTLFKSLFIAGEVHGDPHAGNVFYDYDQAGRPIVSLLDYGCTIPVAEYRRMALLKLIIACRLKLAINPLDCFVALGFDADKLSHISGSLPLLCQSLFEPFLLDHPCNLANWELEKNISHLLGEKRWWFRSAGPADLLLLMRAFQGLVQQLRFLQVSLNWWEVLQQAVGENNIKQAMIYEIPVVKVKTTELSTCFSEQATKLKVEVFENGKKCVSVSLPAEAVLELEQIMPNDVAELLRENDEIDLDTMVKNIKQFGLNPQTLFELSNNEKNYKVWLE